MHKLFYNIVTNICNYGINCYRLPETVPETPDRLSDQGRGSVGSAGQFLSIVRSPTNRSTSESEKSKHTTSKSPMSESVENIKQITLSSPSEFQFKRYHHHQHHGGFPGGSGSGSFDPQLLPPMLELVSPPKPQELSASGLGGMSGVDSSNIQEEQSSLYGGGLKSNISVSVSSSSMSSVVGCGTLNSSESEMREMSEQSAMSVMGGVGEKHGSQSEEMTPSPASTTGSENVFSHYPVYKVPYPAYQGGSSGLVRPKSEDLQQHTAIVDPRDPTYRLMTGYEGQGQSQGHDLETKFRSHSEGTLKTHSAGGEQYSSLTESREYQSELGEIYRLPKKMESKLYHQRHGSGGGGRKTGKMNVERRGSESMIHGYDTSATFPSFGNKEKDMEEMKTQGDLMIQPDISKSFEEAVKIQQSLFHSSLGMFSPIQRQFLQPSRPYPQRERSQSLSEFNTLSSHEMAHHSGRARFPSSSYVEDAPLVIDDDSKLDVESREGLDLSNKKRKMSGDEAFAMVVDDSQEGATGLNVSQSEDSLQEYERLAGVATGSGSGAVAGGSRDDNGTGAGGTKKYGKGNFIKVATGYQCRICCRVIRHMNNTTAHMRIHANVKPYKCTVCNQQFKYEVDRRYHFSKSHVDLFSKMYFPDDKKPS